MESDMDKVVGHLGPSRPMNLALVVQYYTLDALGRIAYDMDFGRLEADLDVYSVCKTGQLIVSVISLCSELPLLGSIVFSDFVFKYIGPRTADKRLHAKWSPGALGKTRSQRMILCLNGTECENEIQLQIVASSDTSATVIRNTLLYLMNNVVVYSSLQTEINRARRAETPKCVYLLFGYWQYSCAGKTIARSRSRTRFFVELLRYSDIQLVNPTQPVDEVNYSLFYIKEHTD